MIISLKVLDIFLFYVTFLLHSNFKYCVGNIVKVYTLHFTVSSVLALTFLVRVCCIQFFTQKVLLLSYANFFIYMTLCIFISNPLVSYRFIYQTSHSCEHPDCPLKHCIYQYNFKVNWLKEVCLIIWRHQWKLITKIR